MPANSPQELHELFARYFSAGDIEAVMSLYEPGATMLPMPGPAVSGLAAIRERVTEFLVPKPKLELQVLKTVRAGDLALIFSSWTLRETSVDGNAVERSGQTSDVLRQQADGTWLLVIDVPHGAKAVNDLS
jgi:uncharacterized protein (TIGR02246 family)